MSGLFKRHARRSGPSPDGSETAPQPAGADSPTAVMPTAAEPSNGAATMHGDAVAPPEPAQATGGTPEPTQAAAAQPEAVQATAAPPEPEAQPSFRERARQRRRVRYLRRLREIQLRNLGGLVHDGHRFGPRREDLVAVHLEALGHTDAELQALERALALPAEATEVREPGIGGTCPRCAALHGSADRFCARCGLDLREGHRPKDAA